MPHLDSGYLKLKDAKHDEDEFRITDAGIEITQMQVAGLEIVFITHEELYQIYRIAQEYERP